MVGEAIGAARCRPEWVRFRGQTSRKRWVQEAGFCAGQVVRTTDPSARPGLSPVPLGLKGPCPPVPTLAAHTRGLGTAPAERALLSFSCCHPARGQGTKHRS